MSSANPGAVEIGVYLLSPTHIGSGEPSGAVDLPIVRERHTGHPYLPATAIKGVLRSQAERAWRRRETDDPVNAVFGPSLLADKNQSLTPGDLVFTDGHLLAFPVRSLQAAFYWVTCPHAIHLWERTLQSMDLGRGPSLIPREVPCTNAGRRSALVLEDLLLQGDRVKWDDPLMKDLASRMGGLLPNGENPEPEHLARRLVCVSDEDFGSLVRRCTAVQARVQLTDGKTTDKWHDKDTDQWQEGNLWYEETLPSDCLFSVVIKDRKDRSGMVDELSGLVGDRSVIQIGGNETVGQGLAWWSCFTERTGKNSTGGAS